VYLPARQIPPIKRSNVVVVVVVVVVVFVVVIVFVVVVVVVAVNSLRGPRVPRLRRGNIMVDRGLTLAVLPPSPSQGTAITYATRSIAPTTPTRLAWSRENGREREREGRARNAYVVYSEARAIRAGVIFSSAMHGRRYSRREQPAGRPAGPEEHGALPRKRKKSIWHSTIFNARPSPISFFRARKSAEDPDASVCPSNDRLCTFGASRVCCCFIERERVDVYPPVYEWRSLVILAINYYLYFASFLFFCTIMVGNSLAELKRRPRTKVTMIARLILRDSLERSGDSFYSGISSSDIESPRSDRRLDKL